MTSAMYKATIRFRRKDGKWSEPKDIRFEAEGERQAYAIARRISRNGDVESCYRDPCQERVDSKIAGDKKVTFADPMPEGPKKSRAGHGRKKGPLVGQLALF